MQKINVKNTSGSRAIDKASVEQITSQIVSLVLMPAGASRQRASWCSRGRQNHRQNRIAVLPGKRPTLQRHVYCNLWMYVSILYPSYFTKLAENVYI